MSVIKSLCFSAMFLFMGTCFAADYQWLTFRMADASEISVAAEALHISYCEGNLHLTSDKVNETILVSEVQSMRFTAQAAGIETISAVSDTKAKYYTINGVAIGTFDSVDAARRALPSGAYIGKNNAGTFKVIF